MNPFNRVSIEKLSADQGETVLDEPRCVFKRGKRFRGRCLPDSHKVAGHKIHAYFRAAARRGPERELAQ